MKYFTRYFKRAISAVLTTILMVWSISYPLHMFFEHANSDALSAQTERTKCCPHAKVNLSEHLHSFLILDDAAPESFCNICDLVSQFNTTSLNTLFSFQNSELFLLSFIQRTTTSTSRCNRFYNSRAPPTEQIV